MQEGSFRCDANVSVRRPGEPLGTRREIKNLNSFKFLQQAIDCEVHWQIELIEDGGRVQQATALFDPNARGGRGETRAMRSKEDAHDYRYFPDPDLPPLVIAREWVEQVRSGMPELPRALAERLQRDDGLTAYDAAMVAQNRASARYYQAARDACGEPKLVANWLMGEVARRLNASDLDFDAELPVGPAQLGALITRVVDGTVSNNGARAVFDALWSGSSDSIDALIERLGLRQVSDVGALEALVDGVIAAQPKLVAEYRAGKDKAFNALVGQAMKASGGKANPAQLNALLKARLAQA